MKVLKNIEETREEIIQVKKIGQRVGFVPTMGYLHKGHLSLVEKAVKENDYVAVSVFVNPTQFGPDEDYDRYPRAIKRDEKLLRKRGVDLLFYPHVQEMYPADYCTYVQVEELTETLCGASRPGHFQGVTTIVNKLFNIVGPDRAYFGQKDGQQFLIIEKMIKDLNMGVKVVPCPTVREEDGLALSSRNKYLDSRERRAATILYRTLQMVKERIDSGERDGLKIKKAMEDMVAREKLARLDYAAIVDRRNLKQVEKVKGPMMAALAVFIGDTRLIDNIWLEV